MRGVKSSRDWDWCRVRSAVCVDFVGEAEYDVGWYGL